MTNNIEELKNNIIFHKKKLNPTNDYFINIAPKIEEYVFKMRHSHEYWGSSRNTNVDKAAIDDRCGKISEVFVDIFLKDFYGLPGNGVDYTVRDCRKKGWDSDLVYPSNSFAVKSCSKKYDNEFSWVFQTKNNKNFGGKDPIVCKDSKEVCFFVINPESNNLNLKSNIYIIASSPIFLIYDILKGPILRKYKGLKLCLYFNDLIKLTRSFNYECQTTI
jgi:hypothetical protein